MAVYELGPFGLLVVLTVYVFHQGFRIELFPVYDALVVEPKMSET